MKPIKLQTKSKQGIVLYSNNNAHEPRFRVSPDAYTSSISKRLLNAAPDEENGDKLFVDQIRWENSS